MTLLNYIKNNLRKRVLNYSIENSLGHIPSALSMFNYIFVLFESDNANGINAIIDPSQFNIIIGKPFGAQTYYIIWRYFMMLDLSNVSYGVKHNDISFVDFSEETLGNALGVASGISYNGKRTWCNISDGALQMGPTLEAIQFIGYNKQDIFLTVDFNGTQLTGEIEEINGMCIENAKTLFEINGWTVYIIKSKDFSKNNIKSILNNFKGPLCILVDTIKGEGVQEMEDDPFTWHYKQLRSLDEITIS